ncbi:thiamine diphosphokinase [Alkalicoccus urumqiensis]|uniref:Thiamine diphosphokinase n=1 Tax=Alkalicoccus urumqiensis TaxID=1548213 RepID=A0A2P6MG46_ALKUR|nr:thiamine diphosphokinase [Alkalicoccus urumqiensis]PRO65272.1 thiamine diphosphokinase [Alkalicoccus urumqiensis]
MDIYMLAGSPQENVILPELHSGQSWIGVDRGALYLAEKGVHMKAAVGDFDSVSNSEMQVIRASAEEVITHPAEKDQTDLELACTWAEPWAGKLYIYGALGGRMDHSLFALQLLEAVQIPTVLLDRWNRMELLRPGEYTLENTGSTYLSFLSVTDSVEGLVLSGTKYPLRNASLRRGSSLCVSNEWQGDAAFVRFSSGLLLMIHSTDPA